MVLNSDEFLGKVVMITGCNRGIGLEAVKLFAQRGADLICCTRKFNKDFYDFIESLSKEYNIRVRHLYFDLSSEDNIKESLKVLIKEKCRVDILINNAGISYGALMMMTPISDIKRIFQTNFFSQIIITQIVAKIMIRQNSGSIVNMGSIAGIDNYAGYTAYGSSKAALMQFTRTIARELAQFNIRVNAVAPGLTKTAMADEMEAKASDEMISHSDMNRMGRPDEIAQAIVWLASDSASFVTGQIIRVDGGN